MTSALMARGSTAATANPVGAGARAADPQGPPATFGQEIDRAVADKRPDPRGKKDAEPRTGATGASPDSCKVDDKEKSPKSDPIVTTLWLAVAPDQQPAVTLPFSLAFATHLIAGQTEGGELGSILGGPSGGGGSAIMPKALPQTGVAASASGVDAVPEQAESPQQGLAFGVKITVVNPLEEPSPQVHKPATAQGEAAKQGQLAAADQMAAPEQAAARGQIAALGKTRIDIPAQPGRSADPDGSTHSEPGELRRPEPGPSAGAGAVNYADVAAAIDTKSLARPKAAENVAPLERSSEVEAPVGTASPQARDFTVRIAGPDQMQATLRIRDAGADVRVAVHTPNLDLTKSLRTELDGLVGRLEATGLKPQVWQPAQSSASDNSSGRDRSEPGDPNHPPRNSRGWQGESDQSQDNRRRSWIEEMEEKNGYH